MTLASFSLSFCFDGIPNYLHFVAKGPHHKTLLHSHFAELLIHFVANFFFDLRLKPMDLLNRLQEHVTAPRSGVHDDYLGSDHYDFYD